MTWSDALGQVEGDAAVEVWVVPRATRPGVVGLHDGALRVRVSAPPTEGKANAEVITVLRRVFGVTPVLISGATSRRKRFRLPGCPLSDARAYLDEQRLL